MGSRKPRYNKRTVLQAIEGSGGIISAVAKRLGCDWATARAYIQRWPETQAAFEAERERILDLAETTIYRAIQEGDVQAAKWVLSRLGRHRGFSDEIGLQHGGQVTIRVVYDDE